ncbi:hypothetical protein OE88DRAFT_1073917 [Heliocybe sulcata]|uniref:Uncharacterized protein n=1 Tax=Heliocybe sulcata TaxID=5364 RepID=A0A5C3MMK4_9AGAM|nr:hypothetical protein OE88DRAFT_1073917 [Heliocybe sulcata]
MSTIYTPLFPATTAPEPYHPLSSSESFKSSEKKSSESRRRRGQQYSEMLQSRHLALACLPAQLHPSSRSPSPSSDLRVAALRKSIRRSAEQAEWDPSNPRWTDVSRQCKLAATSGRWRASNKKQKGRKWEVYGARKLPEREEDWLRWEKKILERREAERLRRIEKGKGKAVEAREEKPRPERMRVSEILHKVTDWQANVPPDAYKLGPEATIRDFSSMEHAHLSAPREATDGDDGRSRGMVQSALAFPVVKRGSQGLSAVKGKSDSQNPDTGTHPVHEEPAPASGLPGLSDRGKRKEKDVFDAVPGQHKRISDIPESSFFPPSFPTHMQTSTPSGVKHKPADILTTALLLSSPTKTSHPPSSRNECQPVASSSSSGVKRARPLTPVSDDARMRSSSQRMPPTSPTPVSKKTRMVDVQPPTSTGRAGRPGSSTLMPSTPPRKEKLPTLTELLASAGSSKGGKAKHTKLKITPSPRRDAVQSRVDLRPPGPGLSQVPEGEEDLYLPMNVDEQPLPMSDKELDGSMKPLPLMRNSSLASPVLGPSTPDPRDGPLPVAGFAPHPEQGPPSMRFTQYPSAFHPQMASTQPPLGRSGTGDTITSEGRAESSHAGYTAISGLGVGQSQGLGISQSQGFGFGFGGMDYNSQFDVEGRVGRVDEILDKDVDFDGWLREVSEPAEDERGASAVDVKGSSQ